MGSPTDLYSNNLSLILRALQTHGTLARHELADITGLTRTTISRAVADLVSRGVIWEVEYGSASPRGGRRPIRLQVNGDAFCMIGIDLRREKVSGCLVHLNGRSECELFLPIPDEPVEETVIELIHEVIEQLMKAATIPVMGIGVGAIGHVDSTTGVFRPQLFGAIREVPLKTLLAKRHGLPVLVRIGAGAAAVGEDFARSLRGEPVQSLAFVVVDYGGIGLGMISDDVLWSNRSGLSEFGHVVIDYNGRPCPCGRHGCLSMYASGSATLGRLAELSAVRTAGIGMTGLADLYARGDASARQALVEAGYYLGYGITDIDCIVHPDQIVLGSSHPHLAEGYMEGLLKHINEAGTTIFGDKLSERVALAGKGSFAIAYGAAAMQIKQFYDSPAAIIDQLPVKVRPSAFAMARCG